MHDLETGPLASRLVNLAPRVAGLLFARPRSTVTPPRHHASYHWTSQRAARPGAPGDLLGPNPISSDTRSANHYPLLSLTLTKINLNKINLNEN